uniref:ADP-dependent (S)-NAD(P)H-hydrate dehydratase n=1 Tax=uncultured Elusimicrobia bacterium TaxID=699876 RepID=A0A650EMG3_9BACT|nr:hypothetical protein Elusimicrob2101_1060 [uncultured Elusimicrobia bacterium]
MIKDLSREQVRSLWPVRPADANKGSFGRVLVVAGSRTMCGAGFLCAKSALLAGAGLVFWALPASMQSVFAAALPEVITLPLPETDDGFLSAEGFDALQTFCALKKPSLAVIGPGMGESPLLGRVLTELDLPQIVDADALNFLAVQDGTCWPHAKPVIYTPHPGEMARLLKTDVAREESTRLEQVQELARQTGGVSLLKGRGTLICAAENDELLVWQNTTGGPALAKAGSGDVLSGVIAGLWAQLGSQNGFNASSALSAALCGVYAHGQAGDFAAKTYTDYGVLASDTAEYIPHAIKEILK